MSKSHLIPEQRMNKNGIMSTKWVLSDTPAKTTREIPFSIADPTDTFTVSELGEVRGNFSRSNIRSYTMEDFDPGAMVAIEAMVKESLKNDLSYQADTETARAFNYVEATGQKYPINNLAVFGSAIMHPESKNYEVYPLVAGLSRSPTKDYLFDADDKEREQAIALVVLAARLDEKFLVRTNDDIRIASDDLSTFVLQRPDDVTDIARIVNERQSDDVEMIRSVLEHDESAMREGLL